MTGSPDTAVPQASTRPALPILGDDAVNAPESITEGREHESTSSEREQFWRSALCELEHIDPETTIDLREDLSTGDVEVYDIRFTGLDGVTAAAWYTRPSAPAGTATHPGMLLAPGYISEPLIAKSWSRHGYAVMSVAPRGKQRANAQVNPGFPGLLTANLADPHAYVYRGLYLDAVRAFDILATQPAVDPGRLGVYGSSQGGALALAVAAFRENLVTCVGIGAPFLCDILDSVAKTSSYPYQEITEYLAVHPDLRAAAINTLSYFDGVNLAPSISCPTLVHLGLRDDVCPPESAYAFSSALRVSAEIHAFAGAGHDAGLPEVADRITEFFDRHLAPQPRGSQGLLLRGGGNA